MLSAEMLSWILGARRFSFDRFYLRLTYADDGDRLQRFTL